MGAVLAARDVVRGGRVIEHLARVITERQQALAADGYTSLAEQRERATHPWPLVVLVIDGWARFTEIYGEAERGRPLEQVMQVLREGLAVGVVAVVTGDRSLLAGRIVPLLDEMWSLRLTDPADLLMAGLTRAQVPVRMPPGRAVRLRDGVVGQVAVVGSAADGAGQVAALSDLVAGLSSVPSAARPRVFRALPRTVDLDTLDPAGAAGMLLGVGGDAAEPCVLPLPATGVGAVGIVGPPGSGRTTTLHTLQHAARSRGWSVVTLDDDLLQDTGSLETLLGGSQAGTLVTIDGFERLSDLSVEDLLLSWLDAPPAASGWRCRPVMSRCLAAECWSRSGTPGAVGTDGAGHRAGRDPHRRGQRCLRERCRSCRIRSRRRAALSRVHPRAGSTWSCTG